MTRILTINISKLLCVIGTLLSFLCTRPWPLITHCFQCSQTCGEGYQTRLVHCLDKNTQELSMGCDADAEPSSRRACRSPACPTLGMALSFSRYVCAWLTCVCASACFGTFGTSLSNFWNYLLLLSITDEGSVPKISIWSILFIMSVIKWCIHLSRSLFLVLIYICSHFTFVICSDIECSDFIPLSWNVTWRVDLC